MKKTKIIKTLKSAKDLKKYALDTGAEVKDDSGKIFNAGGKKLEKRSIKKPEVPKIVVPEKPSVGSSMLAKTVEKASSNTAVILNEIKAQIAAIQFEAAQPVTEWVFDIIRNDDEAMSIRQIVAKADVSKRVIN